MEREIPFQSCYQSNFWSNCCLPVLNTKIVLKGNRAHTIDLQLNFGLIHKHLDT